MLMALKIERKPQYPFEIREAASEIFDALKATPYASGIIP